jgi:hypothetical protein
LKKSVDNVRRILDTDRGLSKEAIMATTTKSRKTKNLIEARIVTDAKNGYHVDLELVWASDAKAWRYAEAGTYRIAALVSDALDESEGAMDVHANPGYLGGHREGTYIRVEMMKGDAAETAALVATLKRVAKSL